MTADSNVASGPTGRTTVRRLPERGHYDRKTIYRIIDEALVCHVGYVADGQPFVIPTIAVRIDDRLYLHGSQASRSLEVLASGVPACITVTLLDGLVLARSAFHHSMNYRSVVVLARGEDVTDPKEKARVLRAIVEAVVPGRGADLRETSQEEIAATRVLSFSLAEASAKVRAGAPIDSEQDRKLPVWAGVLPLSLQPGVPQPDSLVPDGVAVPDYVSDYKRPASA